MPNNFPRIVLLGAHGQVGHELQRALACVGELHSLTRAQLDICDSVALRQTLRDLAPDIVVNATAWTAVDKAESEVDAAFAVNATAPQVMAETCAVLGAVLVHYSTDYVFDGQHSTPYRESDSPAPQSVYGRSKLAGEQAILASGAKALIFRTSWVYGDFGGNFVRTILRLARERKTLSVVADQIGAPTAASLIADVTAAVLRQLWQCPEQAAWGVFHLTASGAVSWHTFACEIVRLAQQQGASLALDAAAIAAIPSSEYPVPAPRPANSRLDCQRLQQHYSIYLPSWSHALPAVVHSLLRQ